jgi:phage anti-repressor protein
MDISELLEEKIYYPDADPIELAKYIAEKYCAFDQDELNMIDLYWDSAFNGNWLYAHDDMVENMFGYKAGKNMMSDFAVRLKRDFEENVDYQIVDKNHEIVKGYCSGLNRSNNMRGGGSNKKYYIITGEIFKDLLLAAKTPKGKTTRKYYIKIEKLGMMTMNAIAKCIAILNQKERDFLQRELEKSKNKILKLNEFVAVAQELKMNEIFYIATTSSYAKQNRFKYGGISKSTDLKARLATYNTGRAEGDLYYYCKAISCHKYKQIESCLESLIPIFKDKKAGRKEMVHMRYDCLVELVEFISQNHHRELEYINKNAKRYIETTLNDEPVIPEPIDIENNITIKHSKNGIEKTIKKINVADWSDEKIEEVIKDMIARYAKETLKCEDFNYSAADLSDIHILWKDFKLLFKSYTPTITWWREKIKALLEKDKKEISVKWRS